MTKKRPIFYLSILTIFGISGYGLFVYLNSLEPLAIAQDNAPVPKPTPEIIVQDHAVRPLPGQLDSIPMFNSNSPEWLKNEGILLSTFPDTGKSSPQAHLNFPFQGRFDLFVHHQTINPPNLKTFYLGVILHNPSSRSVTVNVLQAASYLTQDSTYIKLPYYVENSNNTVYAGPGDRAVHDVLQGKRQADFPSLIIIPPRQSRMLMNLPMPVRDVEKKQNGRSTLMRLRSSGKVYTASLAMFAKVNSDGTERAPNLTEWQTLLNTGSLATPRDKVPTPPEQIGGQLIYSRVAGVAQGSRWNAVLVDPPNANDFTISQPGLAVSYAIATLRSGTLGTNQNQSAKMLVRYPDTAYESHGNYGVEYNINLPLKNPTKQTQTVSLTLSTPLKEERLSRGGLIFRNPSFGFPWFRGSVRLRYKNDQGQQVNRYVHLWQPRGQILEPLVKLNMTAGDRKNVQLDFIYPPDSTPPQVLTIRTTD
ncbi:hypothetical protein Cri9333_4302 [Crinalium epipsammum PCC 9333]|uniref:DUF3370 domain-containing protein n=1 Tax=Crinalium epipsammum PCC 9333 TaxID=1173022 RepID=K9W414_9CYAN|nr:DUF3370 domain-containing protein [Crinalium epipsammum]AFZ15088.1 hypothetical protein Cri9333_4302 [Crinalium epipsammum PCC 9333]